MNASSFLDGLEDDDMWADAPSENITPFNERVADADLTAMPAGPQFKERCSRCGGSGKFRGYTGRILGECRACQGVGFKTFRTSGADRAKARTQAATRKANAREAWAADNADVVAWVARRSTGNRPFDFAVSLSEKLAQYGSLTDGAVAAVRKMIAADAVRDAQRAANPAPARPVFTCEVAKVEEAFDRAQAKGVKTPRLHLGAFKVARQRDGSMKVTHTERREYSEMYGDRPEWLGKIVGGVFSPGRACRPGEAQALVDGFAALADAGSLSAFGLRTGICCCCGAELSRADSIERGMGPICASKYG